MRLVILESPYAGDVKCNVAYARAAMRDAFERGEAPLASHLLYPGALDDQKPEERELGIAAGYAWGSAAFAAVFYTDLGWSLGMRTALAHWRELGLPCEERTLDNWGSPEPLPTWVRAREGSFYRDPVVLLPEGHIDFLEGQARLVLWTPCAVSPKVVLDRVFGSSGWGPAPIGTATAARVAVPGLPAPTYQEAVVVPFHPGRAIPTPELFTGTERYSSRFRAGHVLDFA